ncbi:MAG TPA: hypothetical protein VNO55_00545 [Polyangia bacterium]|nr:hypothetical protein [Polyangia bacterium]
MTTVTVSYDVTDNCAGTIPVTCTDSGGAVSCETRPSWCRTTCSGAIGPRLGPARV